MANTTTKATKKHQADADRMIAAAQALELAARRLKDRAKCLRAGRSCEHSPDHVRDLEWAAHDANRGASEAAAALGELR